MGLCPQLIFSWRRVSTPWDSVIYHSKQCEFHLSTILTLSSSFPEMYSLEKHKTCSRFYLINPHQLLSKEKRKRLAQFTHEEREAMRLKEEPKVKETAKRQSQRKHSGFSGWVPAPTQQPLSQNALPPSFTLVVHSCGPKLLQLQLKGKGCPAKL